MKEVTLTGFTVEVRQGKQQRQRRIGRDVDLPSIK
jgi:hypothetical protein